MVQLPMTYYTTYILNPPRNLLFFTINMEDQHIPLTDSPLRPNCKQNHLMSFSISSDWIFSNSQINLK